MDKTMKRFSAIIFSACISAGLFLAGCGGGGSSSGSSNLASGNFQVRVDMSRIASALPAGSSVSAEISAISHDTLGVPTLLSSKTVPLTYDATDGKYRGEAFLSYITPGINFLCRVKIYSGTQEYAYLGAIVDQLTNQNTTLVNINATSTIKAQATLYYAMATRAWMSDESKITPTLKNSIDSAVGSLVAAGLSADQYILKSNTSADPFLPQNWSFPYTKKLQRVIDAMGPPDVIPPRIVDYTPKNGDTNVPANGAALRIVFSEPMDTSINLNDKATLTASGFSITVERPDNGNRYVMNSSTALYYGQFSWSSTNTASDTLIFQLYPNSRLGPSGLAWLDRNTVYDVSDRSMSTYLKDLAGNGLDTRLGFPSTDFPTTGSFRTAP